MAEPRPPRFAADCMLGTLARWLRILGHDVHYDRRIEDADLVALAEREERTILTADRRLVKRRAARDHILIRSHDLGEQIRQVLRERSLKVDPAHLLGRCLECNRPTDPLEREAARAEVPVYVFRTQERFTRCGGCGRVFWRATHVTRMIEHLEAATAPRAADDAPAPPAPGSKPGSANGRRKAPARRALPRLDVTRFETPQAEAVPEPASASPFLAIRAAVAARRLAPPPRPVAAARRPKRAAARRRRP